MSHSFHCALIYPVVLDWNVVRLLNQQPALTASFHLPAAFVMDAVSTDTKLNDAHVLTTPASPAHLTPKSSSAAAADPPRIPPQQLKNLRKNCRNRPVPPSQGIWAFAGAEDAVAVWIAEGDDLFGGEETGGFEAMQFFR